MSFSRRGFLGSAALGSTACLVGCNAATQPPPEECPPCELPPVASPPPLAYPSSTYFEQLSADLDAAGAGTPLMLLDMDRVDANIAAIVAGIPAPLSYRIVEKSLPSLDLLSYVSQQSGSSRFMVLHLPFLSPLLDALPAAEVLVGKSHRTSAVRAFFDEQPVGTDLVALAARVTFLADHELRLSELVALAQSLGVTLRVAVELDVGLKRSGVTSTSVLAAMLGVFLGTNALQFAGFMGYDGHVAFTPGGTLDAVQKAWSASTAVYQSYVDVLSDGFASLAALPGLVFNSGGSSTFPMYASGTPVNDVAAGGAVLRPGDYPDFVLSALAPALFIATPVLGRYAAPQLPFFTEQQSASLLEGKQGLTIYGGGWPAFFTHPAGIQPAPFVNDPTNPSMVPNQSLVTAPADTAIDEGDWVYYHPRQSDALFQFEKIRLVRGGHLLDETMAPYPRRY